MSKKFAITFAALSCVLLVGCGSSAQDKPMSVSTDQQVQDMVAARAIFDAAPDKSYDNLSSEKKAEFDKLVGGSDKARRWWSTMADPKNGSSNGPSSTGP